MVKNSTSILINGREVGLKFAFPQAKEFAKALAANTDLFLDGPHYSPYALAKLIQTAYKNDCLVKEVEPEVTFEQISDWVDGAAGDIKRLTTLTEIVDIWQKSEYTVSWLDELKKNVKAAQSAQKKTSSESSNKSKRSSGQKATARKK